MKRCLSSLSCRPNSGAVSAGINGGDRIVFPLEKYTCTGKKSAKKYRFYQASVHYHRRTEETALSGAHGKAAPGLKRPVQVPPPRARAQ